ncbi:MAG: flavin reductase family protein [Chloroflexota bacterium]
METEIEARSFYEVLAPRCAVLISTADKDGRPNAAPFSFVMPVSMDPPLVVFASVPTRDTLANIRESGEFVLNIVPEDILAKMIVCSKAFPRGVNEIQEAGLKERASRKVRAPGVQECVAWLECSLEFEKEAGDHVLVVGRVLYVACKDEFLSRGRFDVAKARPVMHIRGRRFVIAEREVEAPQV